MLQLCSKVTDLLSRLGETPETFTGRILFMSMFNDIACDRKGNKDECLANVRVVKVLPRNLVLDNGHLLDQVLKRSGILRKRIVHKELGIISRKRCCWNFLKADVPIFRPTTPLSRGTLKSKGHGKLSIHFTAD